MTGTLMLVLCLPMAGPPCRSAHLLLPSLAEAPDGVVRAEAARLLGEVGPPGEGLAGEDDRLVAGLLKALETDADAKVRLAAMRALLRSASATPRFLRALGRALGDEDERTRSVAFLSLEGRRADLMPALRASVASGEKWAAHAAAHIARTQGAAARPSAPVLRKLLRRECREVRCDAALALLHIDPAGSGARADAALARALCEDIDADPPGDDLLYFLIAAGNSAPAPRTAKALGERLGSKNEEARKVAFCYLDQLGRSALPAVEWLEAALGSDDLGDRWKAARILCRCGWTGKAVPFIVSELKADRGIAGHAWAWDSLGFAGEAGRRAGPFLFEQMRALRGQDQAWAAMSLWTLNYKIEAGGRTLETRRVALDTLIRLAADKDTQTRDAAVCALLYIASPEATPATPVFVHWLAVADFGVKFQYLDALGKIGPRASEAVPALRAILDSDDWLLHAAATRALARIKPDAALVKKLLDGEAKHPGSIGPEVFGEMGPLAKAAVPWLVRQLRHEELSVSKAASVALWKIDPVTARKVGAW